MGYTHYWRRPPLLNAEGFAAAVADIHLILERVAEMDVKLAGPTGTGKPEISTYTIALNGSQECGHRYMDLGKPFPRDTAHGIFEKTPPYDRRADPWFSGPYLLTRACGGNCAGEGFVVDKKYLARDWERPEEGGYFCSCETAFKPYDLIVTAALIRLKEHLPDEIKLSSDGEEHGFHDAKVLCRELFGHLKHFELESKDSLIV